MIAQVYVIKRLPRRFSFFDYQIPENLDLKRGDLVHVPFRNQTMRCIVAGIQPESQAKKIKEVSEFIKASYLTDDELGIYERISNQIIQSVPTLLEAAFLPPRKRKTKNKQISPVAVINKVKSDEVDVIRNLVKQIDQPGHQFIQTTDLVQTAATLEGWIRASKRKQTLVLVSHVHDADMLAAALCGANPGLVVLDSRSTKVQRADIAQAWRSGEIKTLIATRIGSILPAADLGQIFVVRSGSAEHAQYDRNPRYDARNLVLEWQKTNQAKLTFFDVIPRVVDQTSQITKNPIKPETSVLNLKEEHQKSDTPILSDPLLEQISQALQKQKKVIISYNYKSTEGNQKVETLLRQHFPQTTISRIEKQEDQSQNNLDGQITIATQYYFENILNPFKNNQIGLVVELLADLGLSDSYYTATEDTLRRLLELQGMAYRSNCLFLVQTWSADLIKQMLSDPWATLKSETEIRQHFNYPPFGKIWRIYSKTEPLPQINDLPEPAKVTEYGQFMEIRSSENEVDQINQILHTLPDSYIIEVNPERNRQL